MKGGESKEIYQKGRKEQKRIYNIYLFWLVSSPTTAGEWTL